MSIFLTASLFGPAISSIAIAAEPTTRAATSRPATQATPSLQAEITRAVEVAQRTIRTARPADPPARNTLQKEDRQRPPDPLLPIAEELVGRTGLIGFRVKDVIPNDGLHFPFGAPLAVSELRHTLPYLVIAEVDNPTAIQFTDTERRELQRETRAGNTNRVNYVRHEAESRRPAHRLFVATDDEKVRTWGAGHRRSARGTIVAATREPTAGGYVRANVVVRLDPADPLPPAK